MATTLRFIIIPKVQHPWFDEVNNGAQAQAEILSRALGAEIVVDYMPPSICDIDLRHRRAERDPGECRQESPEWHRHRSG